MAAIKLKARKVQLGDSTHIRIGRPDYGDGKFESAIDIRVFYTKKGTDEWLPSGKGLLVQEAVMHEFFAKMHEVGVRLGFYNKDGLK